MKNTYNILGIDETGKSPVIGSVYVAGVLADNQTLDNWKKLGVRDSKKVSPKKREKLFDEIVKTAKEVKLVEIKPSEIDSKNLTIDEMQMDEFVKLLKMFYHKVDEIQADNWVRTENIFWWMFKKHRGYKEFNIKYIIEHHADKKYVAVGAASIIAKVIFDRSMDELRLKYGDFGTGLAYDTKTIKFLKKSLKNPPEIIRKRWVTFQRLLKEDKLK